MTPKHLLIPLAAAATLAVASDPAGRATWSGASGRSEVRVGPGGYGFAGEIGPNGVVGRTTDGRSVGPAAATFASPAFPRSGYEPDVRVGAGGVEVNVPGVHVSAGVGPRSGPGNHLLVPTLPTLSDVAAASRGGHLVEASAMAAELQASYPLVAGTHLAESVVCLRRGRADDAAAAARASLRLDPRPSWSTVRAYYPSEDDYRADLARLRTGEDVSTLWLRTFHAAVCGRADVQRATLERLADIDPTDRLAARLLSGLPPSM